MGEFVPVEELDVYKLSEKLADAIWDMVVRWHHLAQDTVGKQLIRAADSVGANIAEGAADGMLEENRRFVRYAKRSLSEVRFFLRRAFARKLMTDAETDSLRPLMDELSPRLNAYYSSIQKRCRTRAHRKKQK